MGASEFLSRTTWIVALLVSTQAVLGLFRARPLRSLSSSIRRAGTWALVGHAVIGFVLPVLAFLHAWTSMKLQGIAASSAAGLWIATIAVLLFAVQAVIGVTMLQFNPTQSTDLRQLHLAISIVLILLVSSHVVLNG